MVLVCDCCSEPTWEAPQASASLKAVEQRVLASWIEWVQTALGHLERFCGVRIVLMESHAELPN